MLVENFWTGYNMLRELGFRKYGQDSHASFQEVIAPYYKNVPGGFQAAVNAAEREQKKGQTGYSKLDLSEKRLTKKVPILIDPNLRSPRTNSEISGLQYNEPKRFRPYDWNSYITLRQKPPPTAALEHELTHSIQEHPTNTALKGHPVQAHRRAKGMKETRLRIQNRLAATEKDLPYSIDRQYYSTPDEIGPRAAHIKRQYAKRTGNLVTTRVEAKKAYDWYKDKIESPRTVEVEVKSSKPRTLLDKLLGRNRTEFKTVPNPLPPNFEHGVEEEWLKPLKPFLIERMPGVVKTKSRKEKTV